MKVSLYLASVLLVCAALAGAACTSTTPSASPGQSSPVTPVSTELSVPLASLALTPADVPAGYVLTESRAKNRSEVGSLAGSLGWGEGYVVQYTDSSGGSMNTTTILQTITTYPAKNIPSIIGIISKEEQDFSDMSFTTIPSPGIGDTSGGYVGRAHAGPSAGEDGTGSPVSSTAISGGSGQTSVKPDVAEVYFSRGGTLEVIRVTGPGADAATVTGLARNAAARIP